MNLEALEALERAHREDPNACTERALSAARAKRGIRGRAALAWPLLDPTPEIHAAGQVAFEHLWDREKPQRVGWALCGAPAFRVPIILAKAPVPARDITCKRCRRALGLGEER